MLAELRGAAAGEGHRHEEQHDVGFSDEIAQGDQLGAIGGFADEGEIRGFVADFDGHGGREVDWLEVGGTIKPAFLICHTNSQHLPPRGIALFLNRSVDFSPPRGMK